MIIIDCVWVSSGGQGALALNSRTAPSIHDSKSDFKFREKLGWRSRRITLQ
jgi:hypothetical protein